MYSSSVTEDTIISDSTKHTAGNCEDFEAVVHKCFIYA